MRIKEINIEGFASIKKLTYNFNRIGLNQINGENGAGKTSIFNALYWCLYGQSLKKGASIEPWESVKDDDFIGTKVEVLIGKFTIIRCKEYKGKILGQKGGNSIFILRDNKAMPIKGKSSRQLQINKIIGYSAELFRHSVCLPQEIDKLMDEDGPGKKKVFEEAFDALFISRAKVQAEKKLAHLNKQLTVAESQKEKNESLIEAKEIEINNVRKGKALFNDNQASRILEIKERIKGEKNYQSKSVAKELEKEKNQLWHSEKVLEVISEVLEKSTASDDEFKLNFELNATRSSIEQLENEKKNLLDSASKKCDRCGQPMPKETIKKRLKVIKDEVIVLSDKVDKLTLKYRIAKDTLKSDNGLKAKRDSAKLELTSLRDRIRTLENTQRMHEEAGKEIKRLEKEIEKIQSEKFTLKVKPLLGQLEILKTNQTQYDYTYENLEAKVKNYQWLLKDPLSNSGLKAFIFDSMLSKLNAHLTKYSNLMGFREITVMVDLESSRKDINIVIKKREDFALYEELSRGQKQLVNISLIFALNDTITEDKPINLMLIDEAFESLSKENIDIVSDIIHEKSRDKSIHLITHLSSFNPSNTKKINLFLNKKGQTEIAA